MLRVVSLLCFIGFAAALHSHSQHEEAIRRMEAAFTRHSHQRGGAHPQSFVVRSDGTIEHEGDADKVVHDHVFDEYACPYSDPEFVKNLPQPKVVEQKYVSPENIAERLGEKAPAHGRKLSYVSISDAQAAGAVNNMKIEVVWDFVDYFDNMPFDDNTKPYPYQCNFVNATDANDKVCTGNSFGNDGGAQDCVNQITCSEDDMLTPSNITVMKDRTTWAIEHAQEMFQVKERDGDIVVDKNNLQNYGFPEFPLTDTYDADLVVIMTARPHPANIAGYALCAQTDSYGRCTVGVFNWIVRALSDDPTNPAVIESQRHTAFHELSHVLGAVLPIPDRFVKDDGTHPALSDIVETYTDTAYDKTLTRVILPKVAEVMKRDFGCDTLEGMPLEDMPLGAGVHWEARLLGPEYMAYGARTGEAYVSDLTLAFLEETGHYIANYSLAGRMIESSADADLNIGGFGFLQAGSAAQDYTPPPPRPVGALRWGYNAGCSFVTDTARNWPERYVCYDAEERSCTPDNRMSAKCMVVKTWTNVAEEYSYGRLTATGNADGSNPNLNDNCDGGACQIPTSHIFFREGEAQNAGTTDINVLGGHSWALDFIPLRLGYWNCQDNEFLTDGGGRLGEEGTGDVDVAGSIGGDPSNIRLFGGQTRCSTCRCLKSSLQGIAQLSFNPSFPVYGLCYLTNCYREDYLQVGVRGQLVGGDIFWYKCPLQGGKLYIPGYTGAFHCPDVVSFCEHETITGIKYPETNLVYEWIFWGIALGIPLLLLLLCLFPCTEKFVTGCFKRCCGVRIFELSKKEKKRKCSRRILTAISIITLLLGLGLGGLSGYVIAMQMVSSATIPLIFLSLLVITVGTLGILGSGRAAKKGVSCPVLLFFYFCFFICALLIFTAVWMFTFKESFESYIDRHWDVVADLLKTQIDTTKDVETQQAEALNFFMDNIAIVASIGVTIVVFLIVGLISAGRIITLPMVVATYITVANWVGLALGLAVVGLGIWLLIAGAAQALLTIIVLFMAAGGALFLTVVIGFIGSCKKKMFFMILYIGLLVLDFGCVVAAAYYMFFKAADAGAVVNSLVDSDEAAEKLSSAFGFASASRQELEDAMASNLRTIGTIMVLTGIILVLVILSAIYFVIRMRRVGRNPDARGGQDVDPTVVKSVPTYTSERDIREGQVVTEVL